MISWRSLEFRLAAWYCILLMTGLAAAGTVLWFAVNYAMVAALDDLLSARVDRLTDFIDSEFPSEFSDTAGAGKLVGLIEEVDPEKRWFLLGGTRIHTAPTTVFEMDASQEIDFRVGQYIEVEIEQGDGEAMAVEVSFDADFLEGFREELYEYSLAVPDGKLIRIRTSDVLGGFSEESLDSSPNLPWLGPPDGAENFINFESTDGMFRVLVAETSLAGLPSQVQVATSLAPVIAARERLVSWLLWAIPIAALLSFSGGYAIGRAALRPVENVVDVASRMDISRLSERLRVPPTADVLQRLAETFNEMLQRLEGSVERLDQFTADASHELRSPVSVIRTTAEIALRQAQTERDLRKSLEEIHDETTSLTELLQDLLQLARSDGSDIATEPLDLGSVADEVCQQYRDRAGKRRLDLEQDPSGAIVHGHLPSLRRLLIILLDNAIQHTTEAVSIEVAIRTAGDDVVLSVADTGEGIPEDKIHRVFDRFYRADPSRSRSKGGFGLGLSIAKWIAESHGGVIEARSENGKGSTFSVRLRRAHV